MSRNENEDEFYTGVGSEDVSDEIEEPEEEEDFRLGPMVDVPERRRFMRDDEDFRLSPQGEKEDDDGEAV